MSTIASSPAPTSSPLTVPASSPTAKPSPTAPPLGAVWTYVQLGAGEVIDIAHGDVGFVAVGSTGCADDCPGSAAAWFSADGLAWSSVPIPEGNGVDLRTVATDGSTWYAAGDHFEPSGLVTGHIWRSTDARTWKLIHSFDVGQCSEGCPTVGRLAARPGSALLTTSFGVVGATSNGYVIRAGRVAWETGGARKLTRDLALGDGIQSAAIATDGRRIVVLESVCKEACSTRAWSSANGRTEWASTDKPLPILWTEPVLLAFAGGSFVTAGQRAPSGVGFYASPDGLTWTEIRTDLSLGDCRLSALAGSDHELVIAPDGDCGAGIWFSSGS